MSKYGVWVQNTLIRPFDSREAAEKFAATVNGSKVQEMIWAVSARHTAGGCFVPKVYVDLTIGYARDENIRLSIEDAAKHAAVILHNIDWADDTYGNRFHENAKQYFIN